MHVDTHTYIHTDTYIHTFRYIDRSINTPIDRWTDTNPPMNTRVFAAIAIHQAVIVRNTRRQLLQRQAFQAQVR